MLDKKLAKDLLFFMVLSLVTSFVSIGYAFDGQSHREFIGENPPSEMSDSNVYLFTVPKCNECLIQLFNLQSIALRNPEVPFTLVTIEDSEEWQNITSTLNFKGNIIFDPEGNLIDFFGLNDVPLWVVVSQDGLISAVYQGELTSDDLNNVVTKFLNNQTLPDFVVAGDVGTVAPSIRGVDFEKRTLLIFHKASCLPCQREIPELIDYALKNTDVDIVIISGDDVSLVEEQFFEAPHNIRIIGDATHVFNEYSVRATPTQIVVENNEIIWRNRGYGENIFSLIP